MKKVAVLCLVMALLLAGCGNEEEKNKVEVSEVTAQPTDTETQQKIYFEKKVNLGFEKETTIQLSADENAVSGKKLWMDDNCVDLTEKEELQDESCNHVKVLTNDFDDDGVQEILVLFYGGASGTFQQFCMVKYENEDWHIVDETFSQLESSSVKIQKQTDRKIKLSVTNTAFEKVIELPKKTKIKNEEDIHIECRLFQLSGNKIIVGLRLLADSENGELLGDIRQEICFDSATQKLKMSKIEYLSKARAKKEKYETLSVQ